MIIVYGSLDVDYDEGEANLALIAFTSSNADSDADVDNYDEIFYELTSEVLTTVVKKPN